MRIKLFWDHIEENIIAFFIIFMAIMQFLNIIVKHLVPSLDGIPQELAVFSYVWICFLCVSYSTKKGCHVIVSIFTTKYSQKIQRALAFLQYIVDGVLAALFLYGSVLFINQTYVTGERGLTLIPLWIIYLAPFVGYGLSLIRDVYGIKELILRRDEVC